MEAFVEPHLNWRFLEPADRDELERFRDQLQALDNSVLSGFASGVAAHDLHIAEGLVVGGWDAYDSLSACGLCYLADGEPLRMYLLGGVHPVHRHMSIGSALLRWQIDSAIRWRDEHRPGECLWLSCYAELERSGLNRVASGLGFTPERYYYDMVRDLSKPAHITEVEGIDIEAFTVTHSETVRQLHNRCFRPIGGSEVSAQEWNERLHGDDFRPGWSFVALDDGVVVGYAMSAADESSDEGSPAGWTERFGVHPDYRGRGLALALLGHCLKAMRDEGCTEAGIGIDTPDGFAHSRLSSELGYATRDAVALLTKVVAGDPS